MHITALVENKTQGALRAKHGLSLFIETKKHTILFDLGPDGVLFENAAKKGVDLSTVDTVIISHGHRDHGGALKDFLSMNATAKVYLQRSAFEPHYSQNSMTLLDIGLDRQLLHHPQLVLLEGDYCIDAELSLFTVHGGVKLQSTANDSLYDAVQRDLFAHEQSLVIQQQKTALIMGCGHTGIVNILEKAAAWQPQLCVGGYHLINPTTGKTVPEAVLSGIAAELKRYPEMQFYTCHCTGEAAFAYLSSRLQNLHYLACGEEIVF